MNRRKEDRIPVDNTWHFTIVQVCFSVYTGCLLILVSICGQCGRIEKDYTLNASWRVFTSCEAKKINIHSVCYSFLSATRWRRRRRRWWKAWDTASLSEEWSTSRAKGSSPPTLSTRTNRLLRSDLHRLELFSQTWIQTLAAHAR